MSTAPCSTCGRAHVQGVWWPRHPYKANVTPKKPKAKLPDAPSELFMVHDGHGIVEGDGLYGDLEHATVEANQRASDTEHRWYVARYTLANHMMHVATPTEEA